MFVIVVVYAKEILQKKNQLKKLNNLFLIQIKSKLNQNKFKIKLKK